MEFLSKVATANGWLFGTVFVALSLLSVTIVIWRWLMYWHSDCKLEEFVQQLTEHLRDGETEAAIETCKTEQGLVPELFQLALETRDRGKVATRKAIANLIELDFLPRLEFLLPLMVLISRTAPMLGLLGTMSGMIGAFGKIAGKAKVDPQTLADDIGTALFTTWEGLAIAILVIWMHSVFQWWVERFKKDLQKASDRAMDLLF